MVSLISAVLNEEKNIFFLIESIKRQSSKDFEWIVVDGGSNDKTVEIIKKSGIDNLKIYEISGLGLYESVNYGVSKISNKFYVLLGADDYIFQNAVKFFNEEILNSTADLIYFNVIMKGDIRKPHKNKILYQNCILPSSHSIGTLINSELHKLHGYYDVNYRIAADYKFIINSINIRKLKIVEKTVGVFSLYGVSNRNILRSIVEYFLIKSENNNKLLLSQIIVLFIRLIKLFIYEKINNYYCNKRILK